VRCHSTGSGGILDEAQRALLDAVAGGALDDAEEVEFALATLGGPAHAPRCAAALAARPPPALKRLSFGALLRAPDVERLRPSWARLPTLEHGPETSWRAATRPRLEVFAVGPHFLHFKPGDVFELLADGTGPWLSLRAPAAGQSPFDVLALKAAVSSENVVVVQVAPLESADEVRINGEAVEHQTLWVHRGAEKLQRGTVHWVAVDGDVFEVLGLGVRYREDVAAHGGSFSQRESIGVLMNAGGTTTVELTPPASAGEVDDDDDD
jgi:hypothetical protein